MSTRQTTDYLKGLAIVAVLVSHYASFYAFDIYQRWLFEYASEFVAVFFILSGYGLYHSLSRHRQGARLSGRQLLDFYIGRALKIYPLYWASLLLTSLVLSEQGYGSLREPGLHTAGVYLAFPLVVAPGVFWFIPMLMQCYLAAPACYRLLDRLGLKRYLALAGILLVILMSGTYYVPMVAGALRIDPEALLYRNFLFANIFLMALGMAMPLLVERYRRDLDSRVCVAASLTLFLAAAYITRFPGLLFVRSGFLFTPLFLVGSSLFCLFTIATSPRLPLSSLITPLGSYSYPLYLFHRSYYGMLALAGLIGANSAVGIITTIWLAPAFFAVCIFLQSVSPKGSAGLAVPAGKAQAPTRPIAPATKAPGPGSSLQAQIVRGDSRP